MEELQLNELLFVQAPNLVVVDADTAWDGLSLAQAAEQLADAKLSDFFSASPSVALKNFLQLRAAVLDYESRQLRLAIKDGLPSLKTRIQSVLLGMTTVPGEEAVRNPNIFDLFDFIEFSIPERVLPVNHQLLEGVDLAMCEEEKDGMKVYSLPLLEQLFLLKIKLWKKEGIIGNEQQEDEMLDNARQVGMFFTDYNRRVQLVQFHKDNLRSWVQLMRIAIQGCDFEANARTSFILQTFQVILPKLEVSYNADLFTALQLASLAEELLQKMEFNSAAFEKSKTGDFANDRLSQLFRAALLGIYCPVTTTELREYLYQIAFRYIHSTFAKATKGSPLGRHILNTVKNCGTHLLEVLCDDAYSGQGTCKISALLLLSAMVAMATRQESKYILECFLSLNFIGVLVDNVKHISHELKAAGAPQVPTLLSYYDASFALLLRICQTRLGAAYVLNAGLFQSIKESTIFSVDPDIGLGKSFHLCGSCSY
jgi:nuclear pore complex protein Nup205